MKNRILFFLTIPICEMLCFMAYATEALDERVKLSEKPSEVTASLNNQSLAIQNYYFFSKSQIESKAIVNSKGGVVTLGEFFSVFFPAEALQDKTEVTLATSMSNDIYKIFKESTFMFRGITRLPQELRVKTGELPPASEFVSGTLHTDKLSSQIKASSLSVFVVIEQGGLSEDSFMVFEKLESFYNQEKKELTFNIPGAAFTDRLSSKNEGYQAVVVIAISSVAN